MKAVILAGGFATRLRPLSCTRPKTLFPIVNKPLLQHIYEKLAKDGITEVILAVNQQTALSIRQQRIPKHGLTVKYSYDPPKKPLGTAGPIKKAEKLIGNTEPFLVINGDILTNFSYTELIEKHKQTNATATIALTKVDDPSRYGVAQITKDTRITQFIEKPPKETAPTNLINAGIYALNPKIFQYIPRGKAVSMEREIFPKLVTEGTLYGHITSDLWIDIGKPEEYLQTNKLLLDIAGSKQKTPRKYQLNNPAAIDKKVKIGDQSTIGPYAVIGRNVTIGKNTRINNTIIFPHTQIDDNTTITHAIIGENAKIGKNVTINKNCIIADHARIKDNTTLPENTSICPAKEITPQNILKTKNTC
ncbi:MAG: NDP-sugar synthase [Candidatus Bathyarchaeota archaeon]|nr:NDP-sugar synthase [Candidatus Bathyarchaeota archaeon]